MVALRVTAPPTGCWPLAKLLGGYRWPCYGTVTGGGLGLTHSVPGPTLPSTQLGSGATCTLQSHSPPTLAQRDRGPLDVQRWGVLLTSDLVPSTA